MLMTVKEYADTRNISVQATYKKLHRHEKKLQGHVKKIKGAWNIDAYAQMVLDGNFPGKPGEQNQEFLLQEYKARIEELEKSNETLRQNSKNIFEGMQKLIEENSRLKTENEQLKKSVKKPKFEFFGKR